MRRAELSLGMQVVISTCFGHELATIVSIHVNPLNGHVSLICSDGRGVTHGRTLRCVWPVGSPRVPSNLWVHPV